METSTLSHDSISKYLGLPHDCNMPYVNRELSSYKRSAIEDSHIIELGEALGRILHVQDGSLTVSGCEKSSRQDDIGYSGGELCEEVKIDKPKSLNATTLKIMNKNMTFPGSKKQLSCASMDGRNVIAVTEFNGDNFTSINIPAYSRSQSLPTPLKLISAMKGGRQKEGIEPLEKMAVKWAPDVYDPPVTSVSHSLNSYSHQHYTSSSKSKRKKQNVKGKNNKGKPSRGSNKDKKQK